jgi:phosphoglycolate phosphatase-like HAD superfamily hydrolase
MQSNLDVYYDSKNVDAGKKAVLFDLDGTLANNMHRRHLAPDASITGFVERNSAWNYFYALMDNDTPIMHMVHLLDMYRQAGLHIIIVTARSSDYLTPTIEWLERHEIQYNSIFTRASKDHRPDYIVKKSLLDIIKASGYDPVIAFDDRDSVVKMWRENGIPCMHVAEGDF